jgi:hypothetical protein
VCESKIRQGVDLWALNGSMESNRQGTRVGQVKLWVGKCWYGIVCVDTEERVKQYYEWQQDNMCGKVGKELKEESESTCWINRSVI